MPLAWMVGQWWDVVLIPPHGYVKFRYWFNSINFRMNANRNKGKRYRNVSGVFVADPATFNAFLTNSGSATYIPFRSLRSNFRFSMRRDASRPHKWLGVDVWREFWQWQ